MGLETAAALALGAYGAYSSAEAQKSANRQAEKATKASEAQYAKANAAYENYNPASEDRAAIDAAKQTVQSAILNALKKADAGYALSGGVPGNSTAASVNSSKAVSETVGPLADQIIQLMSTQSQRKAAMLGITDAPAGNLATVYFNNAQRIASTAQPVTGSIQLLAQGLKGAFGEKEPGTTNNYSNGLYSQPDFNLSGGKGVALGDYKISTGMDKRSPILN